MELELVNVVVVVDAEPVVETVTMAAIAATVESMAMAIPATAAKLVLSGDSSMLGRRPIITTSAPKILTPVAGIVAHN